MIFRKIDFLYILLAVFLVTSCKSTAEPQPQADPGNSIETETVILTEDEIIKQEVEQILSTMSLSDRIGQMFIISVRFHTDSTPITQLDDYALSLMDAINPGGVILFAENLVTPGQTGNFIKDLQEAGKYPLIVAIDEEGGIVSRLGAVDTMEFEALPSALYVGRQGNSTDAYDRGVYIGRTLAELGFNMDMAPVADLYSPESPVIGQRCFHSDPVIAGEMVAAMSQGLIDQGIAPALKHFPGHGHVTGDPHLQTSVYSGSYDDLMALGALTPFEYGIRAGAQVLMMGHFIAPEITGNMLPVCMNSLVIETLARQELGFDGLVITDALKMDAIRSNWDSAEVALAVVNAGVDILLMPEDSEKSKQALADAVLNGDISENRINESVRRILFFKIKNNIWYN